MNRRKFLKTTAVLAGAALLPVKWAFAQGKKSKNLSRYDRVGFAGPSLGYFIRDRDMRGKRVFVSADIGRKGKNAKWVQHTGIVVVDSENLAWLKVENYNGEIHYAKNMELYSFI